MASVRIPLWNMTRDPALVAFFQRGARDTGPQSASAQPHPRRNLDGGAALREDQDDRREAFTALSVDIGRGDRFASRVLEDA